MGQTPSHVEILLGISAGFMDVRQNSFCLYKHGYDQIDGLLVVISAWYLYNFLHCLNFLNSAGIFALPRIELSIFRISENVVSQK